VSTFLRVFWKFELLLVLSVVLTVTVPGAVAQELTNPDTVIYGCIYEVDSLDPAFSYAEGGLEVIQNIYETLITYKKGSMTELVPMLATEVPSVENGLISEDGLTYTLRIREGVKFHNGDELTPEDVEYSFERIMVLDAGGPSWLLIEPLLGVSTTRNEEGFQVTFEQIDKAVEVNGNHVVFHLVKPFPLFLQVLAASCGEIVDKSWVIEQGGWPGTDETWKDYNKPKREECTLFDKANGTGPFKLERWEKKNEIVLVRNNHYWGKPARIERIVIKRVTEWSTRKLMLRAGDLDIAYVPKEFLFQAEEMKGVRVIKDLGTLRICALFFNQDINAKGNKYIGSGKLDGNGIPPDFFANTNVRKAFNYAFDFDTYIREAFGGDATQPTGPIPAGVPYYNPNQETYHYDLEKAEYFFKKAWDGELWDKGFKFTYVYLSGEEAYKNAIDILASALKRLNPKFNVERIALPWSTFVGVFTQGLAPLFGMEWDPDYVDPHSNAVGFMDSSGFYASTQGLKGKYDRLVKKGVTTLDSAERRQIYYELQRLAFEDAIDIFIASPSTWHVSREWLKGWVPYQPAAMWPWMNYYYPLWKE